MWMYIKPKDIFQEDSQADQILYVDELEPYVSGLKAE